MEGRRGKKKSRMMIRRLVIPEQSWRWCSHCMGCCSRMAAWRGYRRLWTSVAWGKYRESAMRFLIHSSIYFYDNKMRGKKNYTKCAWRYFFSIDDGKKRRKEKKGNTKCAYLYIFSFWQWLEELRKRNTEFSRSYSIHFWSWQEEKRRKHDYVAYQILGAHLRACKKTQRQEHVLITVDNHETFEDRYRMDDSKQLLGKISVFLQRMW